MKPTIINKKTKDLSLIAVFAFNIEIDTNKKSLIASINYRYNLNTFYYTNNRIWDWANIKTEYFKPYTIIRVLKRRDYITENTFTHKGIIYDLNKTFVNISERKDLNYILVLDQLFFTEEFLNDNLFSQKFNLLINSVFIFDHTEWKDLVHKFKILNITLSGGSTTKRQVLSPVQLNLARFLISIDGFKDSHKSVVESFNINEEVHNKVSINNFSKNYKIWLLREYIRLMPNSNNNNRDRYSLILFWNNLHAQYYIKILFNAIDNHNDFEEQLKSLIQSTKINFELDVKFLNIDYVDNFYKKLKASDSINYPLDKRFKTLEELSIAIELYKNQGLKNKVKKTNATH